MAIGFNKTQKKILNLALPAIAGLSAQLIVSLVDTAMVGRLPEPKENLAAMGIGILATWAIVSFFSSLSTGTHVLISRRFGRKQFTQCSDVLNTSLIISITLGTTVTLLFILFSYDVSNFFATNSMVGKLAGDYLFYRFLGLPFFLIAVSYRGFFFGIGKTRIFMYSGILINILNIIFDYILIYGAFGIKPMGLAGAGLGSSLATVFDGLFYTLIGSQKEYIKNFKIFTNFRFNKDIAKKIFKVSVPVSFQNIFILIGFLSFISIIGLLGVLEQAASQTVISSLFISLLPAFGFGIAAQTLVGNYLGRKELAKGKSIGFETAKLSFYYSILVFIIFEFLPKYILILLTNDFSIIQTAIPLMRIAGFSQLLYVSGLVLANALQAAGKSLFVMKTEIIVNWIIFIPLSYFLGVYLNLNAEGAWMAMPVYVFLYFSTIFWKFYSLESAW